MRYIEILGQHKQLLCGSDYTYRFDQRLSNKTVTSQLRNQAAKQIRAHQLNPRKYIKPLGCFVQIRAGIRFADSNPIIYGPVSIKEKHYDQAK